MTNSKPDIESQRIAEALLFSSREPVSVSKLSDIIPGKPNKKQIKDMIEEINITLQKQRHPFEIVETAGGFQTRTVAYYQQWINKLFNEGKKRRMSIQALECLSIIAYKQPVSKANIEKIRGVASDGAMKTLLERNMVSIKGRSDKPGRPLLYGTTDKFLEYFGINRISDLPELSEFEEIAKEKIMESEDIKELEDIQEQAYTGQEPEEDTGDNGENPTQEEKKEEEDSGADESMERPDTDEDTEENNSEENKSTNPEAYQENSEMTGPEENEEESVEKDTGKADTSSKDSQETEKDTEDSRENLDKDPQENPEEQNSAESEDLTQEEKREKDNRADESMERPDGSKPEWNEKEKQGGSDEAQT